MANLCPDCKMSVREQWVKKYLEGGISVPELAKIAGIHENTLYHWKESYLKYGVKDCEMKAKLLKAILTNIRSILSN